jgi:Leucine rich repeat
VTQLENEQNVSENMKNDQFKLIFLHRKILFSLLLLVKFCYCVSEPTLRRVSCEIVVESDWENVGSQKTCFLNETTVITAQGFTIASKIDEIVGGLDFSGNKNISKLPENVHENFPNLQIYSANSCSITSVSILNFKNLRNLKQLDLQNNQIEEISSSTFNDLQSLRWLFLSKI